MGCDIHGYIEFRKGDQARWESFGGRLSLDRNYAMFGLLAGVRRGEALITPRGIPRDVGYDVQDDFTIRVTDQYSGDDCCSVGQAHEYINRHGCAWWDDAHDRVTNPDWHTPSWLTTGEYSEVLRAYNERKSGWEAEAEIEIEAMRTSQPTTYRALYGGDRAKPNYAYAVAYAAVLGAMCAAEEMGYAARLVFFFDN